MDQSLQLELVDLEAQKSELVNIIRKSPPIKYILDNASKLELNNWYLGAGCICQTVWNYLTDCPITENISDYDLVYYYPGDLSKERENKIQLKADKAFTQLGVKIELINEARVHLWYEEDFGIKMEPYISSEDAITCWPTTATCIGVTKVGKLFKVYAPYGLSDMFGMVVKPNKKQITKEVYENKCKKWLAKWPGLKITRW